MASSTWLGSREPEVQAEQSKPDLAAEFERRLRKTTEAAEAEKKQPVNSAAALKEKKQTENAAAKKAPNKKAIYIIAAILALAVCISFFIFVSPRHKIIASGSCGGSAEWSLTEDGTLTISGTGAMENYSDKSAQSWYGHADAINSVIISDGITHIGKRAFSGCSALTEITIPDSVTSIDDFAFYDCYNLSDVYYSGSESDWSKIKIYDFNNCLTDAKIHFNSAMPET